MQIVYIPAKHSLCRTTDYVNHGVKRQLLKIKDIKQRVAVTGALMTIAISNVKTYANDLNIETFTARVDEKGIQLLTLIQSMGYWVAIIFAAMDILKNIKKQDTAAVIAVVIKYVTIYAVLYALPWVFDLVKTLFVF